MADYLLWSHSTLAKLAKELKEENDHLKADLKHALAAYRMEIRKNDSAKSEALQVLQRSEVGQ